MQSLHDENQQLRALLKQYLDGISVNDEVLSAANSLFVVNSKTNVPMDVPIGGPRDADKKHVLIEAATHVKHLEPPTY